MCSSQGGVRCQKFPAENVFAQQIFSARAFRCPEVIDTKKKEKRGLRGISWTDSKATTVWNKLRLLLTFSSGNVLAADSN